MIEVTPEIFADLPVGTKLYDEYGRYMGTITEKIDSATAKLGAPALRLILAGAQAVLPTKGER